MTPCRAEGAWSTSRPVTSTSARRSITPPASAPASPVLLEAADLTTHGVIVGMTGSGKTGLGVGPARGGPAGRRPDARRRPQGRPREPAAHVPRPGARRTSPRGSRATIPPRWRRSGARGWRTGASVPTASPRSATRPTSRSTRRARPRGSRSTSSAACAGRPRAPTPRPWPTRSRASCRACWAWSASTSDPCRGASTSCSPTSIHDAWDAGVDLDLATLVAQVQDPPLRKLGVYDLDAFFPPKDRTGLAMTLNGLLASRAFAAWAEGPDLDLDRLLRSDDGARPACAIVSLAHLGDEERQFVVSLLLGKLITWMRRQPGTDTLRVLVYFDEVMGFVPPTAAPPAKAPILTLFKQARAFGVGHGARHPEPGGRRLQGPVERRDLDDRAPADRAGQGPAARRPVFGGRRGRRRAVGRPDRQPRQAPVHAARRPARRRRRCSRPGGPCRTCGARSPASRSPR